MKKIDYSSEAISRRLRQMEQLRVLSLSLINAKKAQDEKIVRQGETKREQELSPTATNNKA